MRSRKQKTTALTRDALAIAQRLFPRTNYETEAEFFGAVAEVLVERRSIEGAWKEAAEVVREFGRIAYEALRGGP